MGFRVLLIAVSGKEPAEIHRDLGVVPTQEFEEIAESPVTGATLPSGDYLLYINDDAMIVPNDKLFARLSKGAKLLACYVNETCMESLATHWENGKSKWRVHHDSEQGLDHLHTTGTLPPQFSAIRDRLLAQQRGDAESDYVFDIPVELVRELAGFRYDQDLPGASAKPFQVLEPR